MTDWNTRPRAEVEAAAKAGDKEAQSCLRIHESIDRIEARMDGFHKEMTESFDEMNQRIDKLRFGARYEP